MISSIEIKTDRGLKGFKFSHKKKQLPISSYKDNVFICDFFMHL